MEIGKDPSLRHALTGSGSSDVLHPSLSLRPPSCSIPHSRSARVHCEVTVATEEDFEEAPALDVLDDDEGTKPDGVGAYGDSQTEAERTVRFSWRKFALFLGPGWLVAMAYLDPGNLESDLQVGTLKAEETPHAGYRLLWLLLWATAGGLLVQVLSARIGTVTGKDLASLCREEYPRSLSVLLWVITEIAIIGADLQAVIGCAIALRVMTSGWLPLWVGMVIGLVDCWMLLFIRLLGVKYLENLFALLILIMSVCFGANFVMSRPQWSHIVYGLFVPGMPDTPEASNQALGLVGCVIMSHNIYLHSALVQSRKIQGHRKEKVREANMYFTAEAVVTLGASFLINLAVTCTFANPGFAGKNLDMANAHLALRQAFGPVAVAIWAVGLLAAGQSAAMTGTMAGQYVMQGFLNLRLPYWQRVMLTRGITITPLICVAAMSSERSVERIASGLNILQAAQLPFALIPLLRFSASKNTMGDFALHWSTLTAAAAMCVAVVAGNVFGLVDDLGHALRTWSSVAAAFIFLYVVVVIALVSFPIKREHCLYAQRDYQSRLPVTHEEGQGEEQERARGGGVMGDRYRTAGRHCERVCAIGVGEIEGLRLGGEAGGSSSSFFAGDPDDEECSGSTTSSRESLPGSGSSRGARESDLPLDLSCPSTKPSGLY